MIVEMIETTIQQLRELVSGRLGVSRRQDEIGSDIPLLGEGLGLDSFEIVTLITLTEEQFAVEFGEEELTMESFGSLRTLAEVVVGLQKRSIQSVIV